MLDGSHPKFPDEQALIVSINAHVKALKHMPHGDMLPLADRLVQLLQALQDLQAQVAAPQIRKISEDADRDLP